MSLDRIAIVDTETDSTEPEQANLLEVGCVVYSVKHAAIVSCASRLVHQADNQAVAINGIPVGLLSEVKPDPQAVSRMVESWPKAGVSACLAHNASYDETVIRRHLPEGCSLDRPFICSMDDLQWPRAAAGKGLTAIALAHGVGVVHAHRAISDCLTLAALLTRVAEMGVDLVPFLERGLRPKAKFVVADRNYDPARNALAKEAGFRFEPSTKDWWRRLAREDAATLPFAVREVSP